MNRVCCYFLALTTAIGAITAQAEEAHISREAIEWCNIWIPDANETKLPRVLLIGDSITGGYGPKVADALKGKASVARLTTSKSIGDPALLAEVALVLGQCRFDVVHFNNGLHGWGYSEEEYQQHFPELVATIRKHAVSTTSPSHRKLSRHGWVSCQGCGHGDTILALERLHLVRSCYNAPHSSGLRLAESG